MHVFENKFNKVKKPEYLNATKVENKKRL